MQDKTISVLTDKEMQFASDLKLLGMDKNTAKVLTYLCLVGPATSRQLELAVDMRQPDVSRGLKVLRPYIKTSNEGRQVLVTISNAKAAVDGSVKQMMNARKVQDEAVSRVQKILDKQPKKSAKESKSSKKLTKSKKTEDPEVTLDV